MQRIPRALVHVAVVICGCGLMTPVEPPARTVTNTPAPTAPSAPSAPSSGTPGADVTNPNFPGYHLVWQDEFAAPSIDETEWIVGDGAMFRDALLSRDSVSLRDGIAKLTTYTDASGIHHVGQLITRRTWSQGYFEARVRSSPASGEWCAFFTFPRTYGSAPGDPATEGVEIDVFEHRLIDDFGWPLADLVQVGNNWVGTGGQWEKSLQVLGLPDGGKIWGEWRTFGALWTASGYTFYADEVPFWTSKAPPTSAPAPIYLDCEVRDGSWAGYVPAGGYGSRDTATSGMEIDWVRVWRQQ